MSPTSIKARLVVLISGNGSNLQAIIDAIQADHLPAEISLVISNKKAAFGLERARQAGIATRVLPKYKDQSREAYDTQLAEIVKEQNPDWVVLAGWMRLLGIPFLQHFPNRVVNLHPALPGAFPGTHAIERAFQAYQDGEIRETGVMVHLVPDEGVDAGPVLAREIVQIYPQDTLDELEARIHAVEHKLLVDTLNQLLSKEDSHA